METFVGPVPHLVSGEVVTLWLHHTFKSVDMKEALNFGPSPFAVRVTMYDGTKALFVLEGFAIDFPFFSIPSADLNKDAGQVFLEWPSKVGVLAAMSAINGAAIPPEQIRFLRAALDELILLAKEGR